ncbi:MAG: hypothetical protein IJX94_00750 [Clostridia bacterium]|nr:hypothetical protein [Clostridia bacterium]
MENKNNGGFSYTYSAREQEEIRKIRKKYTDNEEKEDKMERLRRLDGKVTQKAQTVSLTLGIVGTLILGVGLSLVMSDLGEILGSHRDMALPLGILLGVVGCVPVCFAYPIYHRIVKRERKKIAPEILRLTDELMK